MSANARRARLARLTLAALGIMLASLPALSAEFAVPFPAIPASVSADRGGLARFQVPGGSAQLRSGDPTLPVKEYLILVPPDVNLATMKAEMPSPATEELPGVFDVAPARSSRSRAAYGTDAQLPASPVTLAGSRSVGRYLVVRALCSPYQYNPKTRKLRRVTGGKMVFTFETVDSPKDAATGDASSAKPGDPKREARDFAKLAEQVLNWTYAYWWYPKPEGDGRSLNVQGPRNALLVLTTTDIQKTSSKLDEFVSHKRRMGFRVDVVNESAWGSGAGMRASERIREYLKTVYKKYRYLLIIGDPRYTSKVPMMRTYPYWFDLKHESDINTDYYYAELTGNWDLNGNGYYAEWQQEAGLMDFGPGGVDLVPELIVGRIPYYGLPADLDRILAKTIRYETMPTVGAWAQRMMIPMHPYSAGEPSWMYGEPVKDAIALPAGMSYYRVYHEAYELVPAPEAFPCTEDAVLAEWKRGYGYVFWATHGGATGAASVFSSGKAPLLNDDFPAFTFQGSCFTAHPETPNNLAYSLLLNGAIVTAASTRMSGGAMQDGNVGMGLAYSKHLILRRERCGDAFWKMMLSIPLGHPVWNNHCSYVLYGDPTVAYRWPTSFSIASEPELPGGAVGVKYGQHLFAAGSRPPYIWSVAQGSLPPGISLDPKGYLSGTPGQEGSYRFTLAVRPQSSRTKSLTQEFTLLVEPARTDGAAKATK